MLSFDDWWNNEIGEDLLAGKERARRAWDAAIASARETCPSTENPGTAVVADRRVVAWFSEWTEATQDWCAEHFPGKWLAWRAKSPEIVPLTAAERAEIERQAEVLSAKFRDPHGGEEQVVTYDEYRKIRIQFLDWARRQGLKAGSDEFGYHDDEPRAAELWREWFADAKQRRAGMRAD